MVSGLFSRPNADKYRLEQRQEISEGRSGVYVFGEGVCGMELERHGSDRLP